MRRNAVALTCKLQVCVVLQIGGDTRGTPAMALGPKKGKCIKRSPRLAVMYVKKRRSIHLQITGQHHRTLAVLHSPNLQLNNGVEFDEEKLP